jgi:N-acetylglucosamine-6-phosphate deacetylase
MTTVLRAARAATPSGMIGPVEIVVDDGLIVAVHETRGSAGDTTLVPGFVDLQVNGIDDIDVASAADDDWDRLDALLVAQGTTTWCPTLVTAPMHRYAGALDRIAAAAARSGPRPAIAGVHLEGPFLGGAPGAHTASLVQPIDLAWLAALPAIVRVLTLGAEPDGALEAVALLAGRDVLVSIGHSRASFDQVTAAIEAGALLVTHLFNGMNALHHRTPGVPGAALTDDRVAVSLIADGVHVHPAMLRLAFAAKPAHQVVIVTDAVAWRSGTAGPVRIAMRDGAPRLADGTLAGSAVTMDDSIRRVVRVCGVDLGRVVRAASTNPARLLGLADRGTIEVGRRADLVELDDDLRVRATWIGGQRVHSA